MDISNWSVDDFVLNDGFREWVLSPNSEVNLVWEKRINEHPEKLKEIKVAKELLVNFPVNSYSLSDQDKVALWERIDQTTDGMISVTPEKKVIPLHAQSTIKNMESKHVEQYRLSQGFKVAAILLICFSLSFLTAVYDSEKDVTPEVLIVFTEHLTPLGVKSTFTLPDSSMVMLNAGSRLYYQENFSGDNREVFLEGEGYFEVSKDLKRSFVVNTGQTSTTALGTSFNIRAYNEKEIDVFLLTGKVLVSNKESTDSAIFLSGGEAVSVKSGTLSSKKKFDTEIITAWTKGIIIFDETPIGDAIQVLESWFGVNFKLMNHPPSNLTVSGKFENESLKNMLTGLGFSARFEFEIKGDAISVAFKNQ